MFCETILEVLFFEGRRLLVSELHNSVFSISPLGRLVMLLSFLILSWGLRERNFTTVRAILCDDVLEFYVWFLAIFVCNCGRDIKVELDMMLSSWLQDALNSDWLLIIIQAFQVERII